MTINRSFGNETKKVAIELYIRLTIQKSLSHYLDKVMKVLKNPQDKLAGSAYGFSRVDIKKGYPYRVSTCLQRSHQA